MDIIYGFYNVKMWIKGTIGKVEQQQPILLFVL